MGQTKFQFLFWKDSREDQEESLNNVLFLWAHLSLFLKINRNPSWKNLVQQVHFILKIYAVTGRLFNLHGPHVYHK